MDSVSLWWEQAKWKALIPNPLGGGRRVVAGRTLTAADENRLRKSYPQIYAHAKEGLDLGLVCYDDITNMMRRNKRCP